LCGAIAEEGRVAEPGLHRTEELARSLAEANGLELVLVELVREPIGRILRVLLDKPGGVTVEDCQAVAEPLSRALDEETPVRGPYSLEVSSPGIERPLVKRADFERFSGRPAAIRLARPLDGRRKFRGTLAGADGDDVLLDVEGAQLRLPRNGIAKAHLVVESEGPSTRRGK
jgi:ribosome maturation factor RimP